MTRKRGSRETERRRLRRKKAAEGLAAANPRHIADGETPIVLTRRGKTIEVIPSARDRRRDLFIYHRNTLAITGLTFMAQINGWSWPKQ